MNQTEIGAILGKKQNTIASYELGLFNIPAKVASQMKELVKEQGITEFDIMLLQQLITTSAQATSKATKAGVEND